MKILSVNISKKRGTHKYPVPQATVTNDGIVHDAHSGNWHRQISMISKKRVDDFSKEERNYREFGKFAENITVDEINICALSLLDRLEIDGVLLEVSQIGKKHHKNDGGNERKLMLDEGIFCRVLQGGVIKPGDYIKHINNPLKVDIITLSDRASSGEYPDKSGPEIRRVLEKHFQKSRFSAKFTNFLIPDDKKALEKRINCSLNSDADIVITTGGTGLAERDITPDVISSFIDREIPGIMEFIRVKYGETIPSALLSRSLAGIIGKTLIFALPGSLKAVSEYICEISRILDHSLQSVKGIEEH